MQTRLALIFSWLLLIQTAAGQINNNPKLHEYLQKFVNRLVSLQDPEDGYLGPLRKAERLGFLFRILYMGTMEPLPYHAGIVTMARSNT